MTLEKKEKSSIVEEEMKKIEPAEQEQKTEEQIQSEKIRFKHADDIYK